jgi:hypothetical protein
VSFVAQNRADRNPPWIGVKPPEVELKGLGLKVEVNFDAAFLIIVVPGFLYLWFGRA